MTQHNFMENLEDAVEATLRVFGLENTSIYVKSLVSILAISANFSFGEGLINLVHNELFTACSSLLGLISKFVGITLGTVTLLKIGIDIVKFFKNKLKKKK